MTRTWKAVAMTVLLAAVYCQPGLGQAPTATIMEIDLENLVEYRDDVSDQSKLATDPNRTTPFVARNFQRRVVIGDIVAVNDRPAKGAFTNVAQEVGLTPTPSPGQAIADTTRNVVNSPIFEIQQPDGTPIGSIMTTGVFFGPAPPGAPLDSQGGNVAIIGGTGAFLGARGQAGRVNQARTQPTVSMTEDPARRRALGGGRARWVLHLIPMSRPEVVVTPSGPAVTHSSDFTLVTASKPATAGEILSMVATGLGPTRPGVGPGLPFPASPLQPVNSPVEVTVNGGPSEVIYAVGLPGAVDSYQVNFRVPPDTAPGTATVQVSAAFVAGPEVRIAIQ